MNKKGLAFFLIFIAILLSMALLVSEIAPYFAIKNEGACSIKKQLDFDEPLDIKWSSDQYVLGFSEEQATLSLFSWSAGSELQWSLVSKKNLRCEKPGYNCFNSKKLDLKSFQPPYGVMNSYISNGVYRDFPFSWDSKEEIRRGEPILLCGEIIDFNRSKLHVLNDQLFIHDPLRGVVGLYDMSKNLFGAVEKSATRDADGIYQMTHNGFLVPASCNNLYSFSGEFDFQSSGSQLAIKSPDGKTFFYQWSRSLLKYDSHSNHIQKVIPINEGDFLLIGKNNLISLFISQKDKIEKIETTYEEKRDLIVRTFFWDLRKEIVNLTLNKWFSSLNFSVPGKGSVNLNWKLYHQGLDYVKVHYLNANQAVVFSQEKGSVGNISLIECQ